MAAPYKPREAGSLKQAIARLVEACGGQVAVAPMLGYQPQHVARLTDDLHPKAQMRIDQILLLEKFCGQMIVTGWLAAERNCIVQRFECERMPPLADALAKLTAEFSDVLRRSAVRVAQGTLNREAASMVLPEIDDLIVALVQMRAHCLDVTRGQP